MVNLFDNNDELFPVVDEDGNIVGTATRGECHGGSKLLHPVVHLHVFDGKGNLFCRNVLNGRIYSLENGIRL